MSQYGMQMPSGSLQRGPLMNVYTGLLGFAVISIIAACAIVYMNAATIAPGGNPFSMHPYDANKRSYTVELPER